MTALCGLLVACLLAGCTTTQETAARKQVESKRILRRERHELERKQHQATRKGKSG